MQLVLVHQYFAETVGAGLNWIRLPTPSLSKPGGAVDVV